MKKLRLTAWLIAALMVVSVFSGCTAKNGDELKSMEPVGEVPEEFKEIVENDIKNSEFLNETIKKKKRFGLWLERIFRLLAPIM